MGLTTINKLPYPEPTDSVDVVRDVKALAEAADVLDTPRVASKRFTATGTGPSQTLNASIAVTFSGTGSKIVLLDAQALHYVGATTGRLDVILRVDGVGVGTMQYPFGGPLGDRHPVSVRQRVAVTAGVAHTFDFVSTSGVAGTGYDPAHIMEFSATDVGRGIAISGTQPS